jgi:hypothetical protein
MNNEYICLVRSKNQIDYATQHFPKPHKTLILGQNVKRKNKQSHHNRIYIVSSLSKFVERYPLEVNNHLHEVIPNNRLVKPYVEVDFFNFNINDTNITESKSRFSNTLKMYSDYLKRYTYMEECELDDWTIMETQEIKDGGLKSHFIGILNNGYYFRNNEEQKKMVTKMVGGVVGGCTASSLRINLNAYDNMYQLLICDQTHTSDTANTLKCVWGDNSYYDLLFVLRYHRIWDEEYIIEKRKIKKLRRDQIKRKRPDTIRNDTIRNDTIRNEIID